MYVVFALIGAAAVLFATELIPNEIVALGVLVLLTVFEPWTQVGPTEAISGFSSPATITVLAMFILSEGIQQTGVVRSLGRRIGQFTGASEGRHLIATLGLSGPLAGFVNNTPLVAVLIPTITDLANKYRISPSKLLMPLSFSAMLGGTLTLIGSSATLLASEFSRQLLGHPISIFEFTPVGLLILIVGGTYLLTIGRRLIPERIHPDQDLTEKFRMREYLLRVKVGDESPLVGHTIEEGMARLGFNIDLDILQIIRGSRRYLGPFTDQMIEAGEVLTLRTSPRTLEEVRDVMDLKRVPWAAMSDAKLVDGDHTLLECTIPGDSGLVDETLISSHFRERYHGTVLAIKRGEEVIRDGVETERMREGDSLLVHTTRENQEILEKEPNLMIARVTPAASRREAPPLTPEEKRKIPTALSIMAGVVAVAAIGWYPIYITALAGVVLMVVTGSLKIDEAYRAVNWNIVFLLAGVIPLGIAMEETGGADFLAEYLVKASTFLPAVIVLALFYLLTAVLANLITGSATIILMIPIAVNAAMDIGANPFAFLLVVMFAASTAFMTPMGYQTNLMVYTPGGYRFTDFFRVGAPLQLILAVVTTVGVAAWWGI